MRLLSLFLLLTLLKTAAATEPGARELVAQLYQAHASKHDPLQETAMLGRYFDPTLLKLYLKDKREAKEEVGRLDGDPLYNAQDTEIKDFAISTPVTAGNETTVTVRFKNFGKPTKVVFLLSHSASNGWRISDICFDDGSSVKKILSAKL